MSDLIATNGKPPAFTVLIPAHNEASVIGNTLHSMLDGVPSQGGPQVIVICNGCVDDTAGVARRVAPNVEVLELPTGSKTLAINAGLDAASATPVIIVDGDIKITYAALLALSDVLSEPDVMAASPVALMEVADCGTWAKAYYRVWSQHGYLSSGVGGSGVYGLSKNALRQIGRFPRVIADDTFVRWEFPLSHQRRIDRDRFGRPVYAKVHAPTSIGDIINCEARWHSGNIELLRIGKRPNGGKWSRSSKDPASVARLRLTDLFVFYAAKVMGRIKYFYNLLIGKESKWHRDMTRR